MFGKHRHRRNVTKYHVFTILTFWLLSQDDEVGEEGEVDEVGKVGEVGKVSEVGKVDDLVSYKRGDENR